MLFRSVTPTSQIVGTQAVFNVLFGRYEKLTQETRDLLVGRYGATPAKANADLVKKALEQNKMDEVITCRPADKIENEWSKMEVEAKENGADGSVEDTLTYAMFPKVAPKFFKERKNGPVVSESFVAVKADVKGGSYTVSVNGTPYNVTTGPSGDKMNVSVDGVAYDIGFGPASANVEVTTTVVSGSGAEITSPVAGTIFKLVAPAGSNVKTGDTIIIVESMKMELEVKATADGPVSYSVTPGTAVQAGQLIGTIGAGAAMPKPVAATVAPAAAPASAGGTAVEAPVAGTIFKLVAPAGSAVKSGDTIIIVESMKMELEVKATANGTVSYTVAPGAAIQAGQVLAEIK